ncbi:hypothetical protein DENSPDRAFT_898848 [Dentipellis sp. KUC8613]|nr:hypothetical protein DENSPDRAFT_898848 [Dentipellis sp. KUC8613]
MSDLLDFLTEPPNINRAHDWLAEVTMDRYPSSLLSSLSSNFALRQNMRVFKDEDGAAVLVTGKDEGEEAVLELAGVLVEHSLPPIVSREQVPREKPYLATQSVTLTGLGHGQFTHAATAVQNIHTLFSTRYRNLVPYTSDTFRSFPALTFDNRYVTPLKKGRGETNLPFGREVDPKGILRTMLDRRGIHTEDNRVLYFEGIRGKRRGEWGFESMNPDAFAAGQIVQLQVAFTVVPCPTGGNYQMVGKLRSIALMISTLRDDFLFRPRVTEPKTPPALKVCGIKRRIGYAAHPVRETEERRDEDMRSAREAFEDTEGRGATPPPPTPAGEDEMDSTDEEDKRDNEERRKRPCHGV